MFAVFDLDGTLADCTHRLHHIVKKECPEWDLFHSKTKEDLPLWKTIEIYKALISRRGNRVEIWTGRSDVARVDTLTWISKWIGDLPDKLLMRKDGDFRSDTAVKKEWLEQSDARPDIVFEDRTRLVEMYREAGITCFQVDKGDF